MRLLATVLSVILLGVTVAAAPAGAAFGITTNASPAFGLTLNGTDLTGTWTVPSTVTETTNGSNGRLGWQVTMTSTTFQTAGGSTLATNASSVVGVSATCAQGTCTAPVNSVTYPVALPAGSPAPADAKVFNAGVNTGQGVFTVTPDLRTIVAADRDAGTYTSTVTLTLAKGP